jgi:hypothetical protein
LANIDIHNCSRKSSNGRPYARTMPASIAALIAAQWTNQHRRKCHNHDKPKASPMVDLPTKVWWATEIRIWGLAAAALLAVISFAATWAQTRWQTELSAQKEGLAKRDRLMAEERIATAQAIAAHAGEQVALAKVSISDANARGEEAKAEAAKAQLELIKFRQLAH